MFADIELKDGSNLVLNPAHVVCLTSERHAVGKDGMVTVIRTATSAHYTSESVDTVRSKLSNAYRYQLQGK
jgi:hypothetical protein